MGSHANEIRAISVCTVSSPWPSLDMHCHVVQAGNVPEGDRPSILSVTFTPYEWLAHGREAPPGSVVWALGLHPWEIQDEADLDLFLAHLPECEAVGEIGVDRSHFPKLSLERQRPILETILGHEETRKRIVSLHAWQAYPELVSILETRRPPGSIIHWFMGTGDTLRRAIDLDVFFSVNDAMLMIPEGVEVVGAMPRERVLTETDAPSIEHGTGRSLDVGETRGRPLGPGELDDTERKLAEIWGVDQAEVRSQLWRNLAELESRVERRPFSTAT
jgi:TatD DNase family protein